MSRVGGVSGGVGRWEGEVDWGGWLGGGVDVEMVGAWV